MCRYHRTSDQARKGDHCAILSMRKDLETLFLHCCILCTVLYKSKANEFQQNPAFLGFPEKCRVKRYFKVISPNFRDAYCSGPREVSYNNSRCMIILWEFSSDNLFLPKLLRDISNDNLLPLVWNLPFINRQKL